MTKNFREYPINSSYADVPKDHVVTARYGDRDTGDDYGPAQSASRAILEALSNPKPMRADLWEETPYDPRA